MGAGEWKPRTRWPGMSWLRRCDNRRYRTTVRRLIRLERHEDISPPRRSSAKWAVW